MRATSFGLGDIARAARNWINERQLRCATYDGVSPVRVQLIFRSESDALEARRAFENTAEADQLRTEVRLRGYQGAGLGVMGAYIIEGLEVQLVGPEIRIER